MRRIQPRGYDGSVAGIGRREHTVSVEENMALVRRFFEARGKADLDAIEEMLAPDFVVHTRLFPDQQSDQSDREAYKRSVAEYFAAFSNVRFLVEDQVAGGEKVVTRFIVRGTHDRRELMGVAPTGRETVHMTIVIHRISGGKIAEEWGVGTSISELREGWVARWQRLEQERIERERVEQELQVARRIQRASLPNAVPTLKGWQIAHHYQPAREVGGDFYDFHLLSDDRVGFVVGDATGKGVPAALVMANTCGMLRRLMRNSEKQGRSRDFMLTPNLDQKAVPHGSRLLPGLIVRSHRGLVEGSTPLLHCSQSRRRSSIAHLRSGDPHPRCPRPVAPLQEREGFLEVRSGSPARLFPHTPLPEPVQPEDARPGGGDERSAGLLGAGVVGRLGGLPHSGHHPDSGGREGKGVQEGTVCRRGHFRQVRLEDRVDLRVQGRAHHHPRGRDHSLLLGRGGCRREAHRGYSHPPRWSWRLPGRQGFLLGRLGAALAGRMRSSGGSHSQGQFPQSVAGSGSSLGLWQAPDHRGGYKPAQGSVLSGAPQGKDPWWPVGSSGGQDHSLHLRAVYLNGGLGRPLRHLADLLV